MKHTLGKNLALLAKSVDISQVELSEATGLTTSQINKFFKGLTDLQTGNLLLLLKEFGIDLEQLVQSKLSGSLPKYETRDDAFKFLINNLSPRGQQTQLKNLEWINEIAGTEKIPLAVKNILKREVKLI